MFQVGEFKYEKYGERFSGLRRRKPMNDRPAEMSLRVMICILPATAMRSTTGPLTAQP